MRFAFAGLLGALLLTGCIIAPTTTDDQPPPTTGGGWGSGWGGGSGTTGWGCHADSECSGGVCARNGECTTAANVRIVHVMWTVKTKPASDLTCANAPKLDITFEDNVGDMFGFSPVPCNAGKYTVDKLPLRYGWVDLVRAGDASGGDRGMFDETGNTTLDLPY